MRSSEGELRLGNIKPVNPRPASLGPQWATRRAGHYHHLSSAAASMTIPIDSPLDSFVSAAMALSIAHARLNPALGVWMHVSGLKSPPGPRMAEDH